MVQTTLDGCPRDNIDQRITVAYYLFKDMPLGMVYKIYKVPRAGGSTALAAESINRGESFVAITPTTAIAEETYTREASRYADFHPLPCVHIPANHECLLNRELIDQYPLINRLPILPIPETCISKNGKKCEEYDNCPVTELLRIGNSIGHALTYHKLAALMVASFERPDSMAARILEKLLNCTNFIFDEAHFLQDIKTAKCIVYSSYKKATRTKPCYFDAAVTEKAYPHLFKVVEAMNALIGCSEVKERIGEMKAMIETDKWRQHKTNVEITNPCRLEIEMDVGTFMMACYNEIIGLAKHVTEDKMLGLDIDDILALYDYMQIVLADRIQVHSYKDHGHNMVQLVAIDRMMHEMIRAFNTRHKAQPTRIIFTTATFGSFDLSTVVRQRAEIKELTFGPLGDPMQTNANMTIICDSRKLHQRGINSMYNSMADIVFSILYILSAYGLENVEIYAMSKKDAADIEEFLAGLGYKGENRLKINYYKSSASQGVALDKRIMILVGSAEKPSNIYDIYCDTKEESIKRRIEAKQIDTYQAMSRVKDPAGIEPSIVFALGITPDEMDGITAWGYNRSLQPDNRKQKQLDHLHKIRSKGIEDAWECTDNKYVVECCDNLTKPKIIKAHSLGEMIAIGRRYKELRVGFAHGKEFERYWEHIYSKMLDSKSHTVDNAKSLLYKSNKYLISDKIKNTIMYNNSIFNSNTDEIYSERDLLWHFCNRSNVYAQQNADGSYTPQRTDITDKLLDEHIAGTKTIGVYALDEESNVRWICWDIDAHKDELRDTPTEHLIKERFADEYANMIYHFLTETGIRVIFEKSGSPHSYHIWMFVKPMPAGLAKAYGNDVLKALGLPYTGKNLPKTEVEVYPKQTEHKTNKKMGNLVKLPFATHRKNGNRSTILIDGKWVGSFEKITLGAVDLTGYVPYKDESEEAQKAAANSKREPSGRGVRPIFDYMIHQDLSGSEGHMMRIAITREFYCNGMTNPEELVELFHEQPDYDPGKSMYHVMSIISEDYGPFKMETLQMHCPGLVEMYYASRGIQTQPPAISVST